MGKQGKLLNFPVGNPVNCQVRQKFPTISQRKALEIFGISFLLLSSFQF